MAKYDELREAARPDVDDEQRDCVDAILEWLNAESDDDTVTVVEHSEGQTINISHANVVIID